MVGPTLLSKRLKRPRLDSRRFYRWSERSARIYVSRGLGQRCCLLCSGMAGALLLVARKFGKSFSGAGASPVAKVHGDTQAWNRARRKQYWLASRIIRAIANELTGAVNQRLASVGIAGGDEIRVTSGRIKLTFNSGMS